MRKKASSWHGLGGGESDLGRVGPKMGTVNFGPAVIRGRLGLGGSWGLWGGPLVPAGCLLASALLLL